ncbi:hypothetical protein K1719_022891 [Acacia pycnantha]|nr:hypothetical protein K1719_022891 [Acacia pycnantha]
MVRVATFVDSATFVMTFIDLIFFSRLSLVIFPAFRSPISLKPIRKEDSMHQRNKPMSQQDSMGQVNKPKGQQDSMGQVNKPISQQDSMAQVKKPMSQQDPMGQVNKPMSQQDAMGQVNKPMSQQDSMGQVNKPMSQQDSMGQVNKPMSQQDPMGQVNNPMSQQDSMGNKYEVSLSYNRDEDQDSFPSLLYSTLRKAKISVLKDDISNELLQSIIEGSKISIIIFSEQYASSKWCLEELTKIMEFRRAYDHVVLPIFYGVDRYDVRNQESRFGQAFQDLVQRISPTEYEVSRWRRALSEVGGNYGFVVPYWESSDKRHIQNIVKLVRDIFDWKRQFATEDLDGVSSQVKEVVAMLQQHQSKDFVSIGIWGMGGIGKTTVAEFLLQHIQYEFEYKCFLSNVRETWERKGKLGLTRKLRFAMSRGIVVNEIEEEEVKNTKVLIVVDDVNGLDQLNYLCGNCYGKGSRIIITTRDLHLLEAFKVDLVYSMKLLSDHESLQLFSKKAFKQASPKGGFIQLSRTIVSYAEGLPLALEFHGSFLSRKSLKRWESALKKLSTLLPPQIYNTLKLSFDSLDDNKKEIFLNIVLFYIGEDTNDVIQKLDGHGCNASIGIRALVDRSLVTIDKNNKLGMHNLLELMGRQIIRESSQNGLPNRGHRYEVFLSFRGDTRATFTSHLYSALCNAGIIVFKDDVELPRGKHIKMELRQAMGSSKIAIIIFSKEYAGSKWCLEELSIIMELHKSNGQVLLPVFYDVDPSEIRNQTSSFGEAFKNLIQKISPSEVEISNWKTALAEAGGIAGIVVLGSRDESENVKVIVENVCDILDKKDLFVAEHPIGVDDRVQEVITMLQNHQSKDVLMVGIWGMGGVGKTTVAKAIYNEIGRTFESRSYLPNIREVWDQEKGQVSLQNQLLSEIFKATKMKITSIESGKITLRDRLRHRKALVVLDDVDELAQLNALVGSRDWFKLGSIIIITTRNERLLLEVDCGVYLMKNLNERESIELLSWHAFKQESPKEDFTKLSRDIVAYSGGLPLAVEVIGSYLFGREVQEWKSVLEKLKKIPNERIQKKLKISFDGLDNLEKEIFLDISCFFIGMDKNDVSHILNGCEFFADIGIKTLVERSLVTIDEKNMLGMHDLLRDMGREIISEQSQKKLGKRSRLWHHKDALAVLLEHMGTEAIEGLSLKLSQNEKMHFQTEPFKMMKRLRLLHLEDVQLRGDYKYISRDLRWLCWHGFPIKYIPINFCQQKLVAIDLQYSSLRQVWKEPLLLEMLKILNLSHSANLEQTPDFSKLPNLEKLILKDCPSLSMIHHSIGLLDQLLLLDLEDCIGLLSLPRSIYRLKCLKTLNLFGCVMVEKLEEDIEQMESLTTLIAPTIKQVPFSIVKLKSLLYLSICGYEGLSHHVIPSLYWSWMSPTKIPLPFTPTHEVMPSSLFCDMHGPSTIPSSVPKPQKLLLEDKLEIPNSLCGATKDCMDIPRLEDCLEHLLIQIGKNSQVFDTLSKSVSQGLNLTKYNDDCILPDENYPYWLTFKGKGDSVKFKVPLVNGHDHLKGMTICCIYSPSGELGIKACESCLIISLIIINYTKSTTLHYKQDSLTSFEEAKMKEITSNLESGDQVEVIAVFGNGYTVVKTVVYLIYNESFDEQIEPSTFEATNLIGTEHKCEDE